MTQGQVTERFNGKMLEESRLHISSVDGNFFSDGKPFDGNFSGHHYLPFLVAEGLCNFTILCQNRKLDNVKSHKIY